MLVYLSPPLWESILQGTNYNIWRLEWKEVFSDLNKGHQV